MARNREIVKSDEKPSAGRRAGWRFWLAVCLWATVCAGLAWGGVQVRAFLQSDARFSLQCAPSDANCASLEIHGAKHANAARLRGIFAKDLGKSIFAIPLAERRRGLLAVDWVATASVSRIWPNRIVATVTERTPVAFARLPIAGSMRHFLTMVDKEGVLMALPPRARFNLPVLSGLTETQTDPERQMRVQAMEHLLLDLGPNAKDVAEVNAASVQEMRVIAQVGGRGVELWLGDQHYRSRFQNFMKNYPEMSQSAGESGVFDLRLDDRILAK